MRSRRSSAPRAASSRAKPRRSSIPSRTAPCRVARRRRPSRSSSKLRAAGADVELEKVETWPWPVPYDHYINPLAINLTAFNTFVLICSSVTMVLALSAIQAAIGRSATST